MPLLMYTEGGFLKAAARGNFGEVALYLKKDAKKWVKVRDRSGSTALHIAAENGHLEVIRQLADAGADVNDKSRWGHTPLSLAVSNNRHGAAALLLERGAPANDGDESSRVLATAVSHNSPNMVDLLLKAKANPDAGQPLMTAAANNYREIALKLLAAGAKTDIHDDSYRYPIHHAAATGSLDLMKALLDKGADINIRDNQYGYAPLHWAVVQGHNQMAELLLARGADAVLADNKGHTALDLAYAKKNMGVIRLLESKTPQAKPAALPAGAPNAENDDTETWLRMGESKVAHVGTYPALSRRLTEIFNFSSRERIIITENLRTGQENMSPPDSFDAIAEDAVKKALAAFRALGGAADDEAVLNPRGIKKPRLT